METYLKAVKLFRNDQKNSGEPEYSQVCAEGPLVAVRVCVLQLSHRV